MKQQDDVSIEEQTIIIFDENNYMVFSKNILKKNKGIGYLKERLYFQRLVEDLWEHRFQGPWVLKEADKIEVVKEVFGLEDLTII